MRNSVYRYVFAYDGKIEEHIGTNEEIHAQAEKLSAEHSCEVKVCIELRSGSLVWKFSYIYGRFLGYE